MNETSAIQRGQFGLASSHLLSAVPTCEGFAASTPPTVLTIVPAVD